MPGDFTRRDRYKQAGMQGGKMRTKRNRREMTGDIKQKGSGYTGKGSSRQI